MRLTRIALRCFRNITDIEFEPHQILNVFVGENAQGKTSLIEAIYFLSTLRSFRTSKILDLVKRGEQGAAVEGRVLTRKRTEPLTLKIKVGVHERRTAINEKPVPSRKFAGQLRAVVFSPESLSAIKGGPELRRDLIDQALLQMILEGGDSQREFSKVLRQRNALLKQLRDGEIDSRRGKIFLEGLDEKYISVAAKVTFLRLNLLKEIFPFYKEALCEILGSQVEPGFLYQSGGEPWTSEDENVAAERMRSELSLSTRRVAEQAVGTTLTGPHRHDISFLFNENDSRIFCSQGQQRALILAFKIAEIMYHRKAFESYPLLLLDDVLSEFDENKRRYLIDFLRRNEAQTFLTTTDQTRALGGTVSFEISGGAIRQH